MKLLYWDHLQICLTVSREAEKISQGEAGDASGVVNFNNPVQHSLGTSQIVQRIGEGV